MGRKSKVFWGMERDDEKYCEDTVCAQTREMSSAPLCVKQTRRMSSTSRHVSQCVPVMDNYTMDVLSQGSIVQWTFRKREISDSHPGNPLVGHRCYCCWLMVGLSLFTQRILGHCGLQLVLHALPTLRAGQRRRYLLPSISSMLQINDLRCTTNYAHL